MALPVTNGSVQQAQFAPGKGGPLAVIDRQGGLWVWSPAVAAPKLVDESVLPGLGWSKDGASLAYVHMEITTFTLRRLDVGSGRQVDLLEPGPPLALPSFSPDGAHLVVASGRDGVPALYRLSAQGGGLSRLTNRSITPEAFVAGARGVPNARGQSAASLAGR